MSIIDHDAKITGKITKHLKWVERIFAEVEEESGRKLGEMLITTLTAQTALKESSEQCREATREQPVIRGKA